MAASRCAYYWPWRMVNRYRTLLLCVLLLFPLNLFSATAVRVAIAAEDYPPFYYQNPHGDMDGFSVRVLQALSQQLEFSLSWQRLPWKRVMHHVQEGRADLIMVMYHTDSRAEHFQFSEVSYLQDALVLLCHRPCIVNFSGDLDAQVVKELALVRGFSYGKALDSLPLQALTLVESDQLLIQLLAHGRLQLGLVSYLTVSRSALLQQHSEHLEILQPELCKVDIYFAFSRRSNLNAGTIAAFNQALANFIASPEYRALRAEYQLDWSPD